MSQDQEPAPAPDPDAPLFPGKAFDLQEPEVRAEVFPLGIRHLAQFRREIGGALGLLAGIKLERGGKKVDAQAVGMDAMRLMVPYLTTTALDLLAECVRIKMPDGRDVPLEDLPHWHLPTLAQAWLEESFGDPRKRLPWIQAMEKALSKATGGEAKGSIWEMLSKHASLPDTPSETSTS